MFGFYFYMKEVMNNIKANWIYESEKETIVRVGLRKDI
jgi:hypothetical protein